MFDVLSLFSVRPIASLSLSLQMMKSFVPMQLVRFKKRIQREPVWTLREKIDDNTNRSVKTDQ